MATTLVEIERQFVKHETVQRFSCDTCGATWDAGAREIVPRPPGWISLIIHSTAGELDFCSRQCFTAGLASVDGAL